jgi:hypothetical protein
MKTTTASPISFLEFIAHLKSRLFPSISYPRMRPSITFTAFRHSSSPAAHGDKSYHCFTTSTIHSSPIRRPFRTAPGGAAYISEAPFSMAVNELTVASDMSQGETTVETGNTDFFLTTCHLFATGLRGENLTSMQSHRSHGLPLALARPFRVEPHENSEGVCTRQ